MICLSKIKAGHTNKTVWEIEWIIMEHNNEGSCPRHMILHNNRGETILKVSYKNKIRFR